MCHTKLTLGLNNGTKLKPESNRIDQEKSTTRKFFGSFKAYNFNFRIVNHVSPVALNQLACNVKGNEICTLHILSFISLILANLYHDISVLLIYLLVPCLVTDRFR